MTFLQKLNWTESEWSTETTAAVLNGIEGSVTFTEADEWFWQVWPTSSRSEFPECYDAGVGEDESDARAQAEVAMFAADKSYQRITYA